MGLRVILAQVQDGWEHIMCCASRTTTTSERHYDAINLECLTIIWALWTFRHYMIGSPFEVIMDHCALQWLKTMKSETAILHR